MLYFIDWVNVGTYYLIILVKFIILYYLNTFMYYSWIWFENLVNIKRLGYSVYITIWETHSNCDNKFNKKKSLVLTTNT